MKFLGGVAAVVLTGVAVIAVGVGVRSIPDVRRYLKMRNM
ncbi:hypothetical protein BH18ACT8_BH18ACT8_07530 [soil metagenome]